MKRGKEEMSKNDKADKPRGPKTRHLLSRKVRAPIDKVNTGL